METASKTDYLTRSFGSIRSDLEKEVDAEILNRVEKGFALLQQEWGDEWVDHIDPRNLDLGSCSRCVLGQLYGHTSSSYQEGLDALGEIDGSEYGFDARHEKFDELTEVWVEVITGLKTFR